MPLGGGVLSSRRWLADAALAVVVTGAQVGVSIVLAAHRSVTITPAGYALLAVSGAVLVARRGYPAIVLAVTSAAAFGYRLGDDAAGGIWISVIIAFATAVYLRRRAAATVFLVVGYVGFLWGPVLVGAPHRRGPSLAFALGLATGLVVMLALSEGARLRHQRAVALAQAREQEALRYVGEERLRIARDLHDVVAHSIAVINVQATSALHLMGRQPERAQLALSAINDVSKQALVELRSVVGVLRAGDDAPLAPTPGLARLAELVDASEAAGLDVRVTQRGEYTTLPTEVDIAVYRIIQEALTNAAKHSEATGVRVRLDYLPDEVVVQVDDDGTALSGPLVRGNGIIGMTERAHALCGSLDAGPLPRGGFRVEARLPLQHTHTAPTS